jgi:hypothetical protein
LRRLLAARGFRWRLCAGKVRAYASCKFSRDDAVWIVEGAERGAHTDEGLEEWRTGGATGEMDFERGTCRSVEVAVQVARHLLTRVPAAEGHAAVRRPALSSVRQCAHKDHPSAPEALLGGGKRDPEDRRDLACRPASASWSTITLR